MNTATRHIDTEILRCAQDEIMRRPIAADKDHNCPNCGCEWCDLEKDLDECFTCGYPLPVGCL
jgi:uncharacterized UBP type Zn finger protein